MKHENCFIEKTILKIIRKKVLSMFIKMNFRETN